MFTLNSIYDKIIMAFQIFMNIDLKCLVPLGDILKKRYSEAKTKGGIKYGRSVNE